MNRDRIADYLDGLLDGEQAREVEAYLESHPDVAAEARRMREVLYRPYPVPPPSPGLRDRILVRRRRGPVLLRYAAAFAAGVLATLLVQSWRPDTPGPVVEPREDAAELVFLNSRIR
jgi:anti-sigma factor RsiW